MQRDAWTLLCLLDIALGLHYLHGAGIVSAASKGQLFFSIGAVACRVSAAAALLPSPLPLLLPMLPCLPVSSLPPTTTRPRLPTHAPAPQQHGDLKPANVLLKSTRTDRRGFVCKLGDFGLSRALMGEQTHVETQVGGWQGGAPFLQGRGQRGRGTRSGRGRRRG